MVARCSMRSRRCLDYRLQPRRPPGPTEAGCPCRAGARVAGFEPALATPGHSGSDPVAAQRQLSELLARRETLLPVERLLALVELKEVEQRLILQAENKRMRDDAQHDESRDKLLAINRRLAAESDENVRLRKALDEARAKLEAITHIERSINDRKTNGSHTP